MVTKVEWNTRHRELRETPEYTSQLQSLGDIQRLDEALAGACWALSTNPEEFDEVPGFEGIRMAKTDEVGNPQDFVPPLRIWFRISADDEAVDLLFIEADVEEDVGSD